MQRTIVQKSTKQNQLVNLENNLSNLGILQVNQRTKKGLKSPFFNAQTRN
ncbi:hypothetical protein PALB_23970 [Pseudoalteromonas luteoviolacea B = ATCC 29581]|nr:hypothetical protein PALB_23970 [Pseudoalteromonas luteoviolacea B = ATCC 29581]